MQSNSTILITGGTGSLGQELTRQLLNSDIGKVIVYSRNEYLQVEMRRQFNASRLRFFIGDVRDVNRLKLAFKGVDYVIHAAAIKGVDVCAYNPYEAIRTNVLGAQNIIEAAIDCGVKKVIAISSDKSANPINLYGATKLCADKLFIASNAYSGKSGCQFSVVRFGNFINSNGSVIPYWQKLIEQGATSLPVTDPEMTRFLITLENAAAFVLRVLRDAGRGEIWCPKMDRCSLVDLAKSVSQDAALDYIGKRPGEKLHEDMIVSDDADRTFEYEDCFVTVPEFSWMKSDPPRGGVPVAKGFQYCSAVAR